LLTAAVRPRGVDAAATPMVTRIGERIPCDVHVRRVAGSGCEGPVEVVFDVEVDGDAWLASGTVARRLVLAVG